MVEDVTSSSGHLPLWPFHHDRLSVRNQKLKQTLLLVFFHQGFVVVVYFPRETESS